MRIVKYNGALLNNEDIFVIDKRFKRRMDRDIKTLYNRKIEIYNIKKYVHQLQQLHVSRYYLYEPTFLSKHGTVDRKFEQYYFCKWISLLPHTTLLVSHMDVEDLQSIVSMVSNIQFLFIDPQEAYFLNILKYIPDDCIEGIKITRMNYMAISYCEKYQKKLIKDIHSIVGISNKYTFNFIRFHDYISNRMHKYPFLIDSNYVDIPIISVLRILYDSGHWDDFYKIQELSSSKIVHHYSRYYGKNFLLSSHTPNDVITFTIDKKHIQEYSGDMNILRRTDKYYVLYSPVTTILMQLMIAPDGRP